MTEGTIIVIVVVLFGLAFDFTNGFHDTANAMATSVATGALSPRVAVALSGGVAYLLARTALAPVDRLRSLTEEVTADRLDRRLPVGNTEDELGRLTQTINAMSGSTHQVSVRFVSPKPRMIKGCASATPSTSVSA